jgi:hypothetical protein
MKIIAQCVVKHIVLLITKKIVCFEGLDIHSPPIRQKNNELDLYNIQLHMWQVILYELKL